MRMCDLHINSAYSRSSIAVWIGIGSAVDARSSPAFTSRGCDETTRIDTMETGVCVYNLARPHSCHRNNFVATTQGQTCVSPILHSFTIVVLYNSIDDICYGFRVLEEAPACHFRAANNLDSKGEISYFVIFFFSSSTKSYGRVCTLTWLLA